MREHTILNRMKADLKQHRSGGFTLAEVLLVVAIIAILVAVTIPAVAYYKKTLRQKELDEKAQLIYISAQNELAILEAQERRDIFDPDVYESEKDSGDKSVFEPKKDSSVSAEGIYYISHAVSADPISETDAPLSYALMYSSDIDGNMDDAVSENSWIIEYDYSSATIYGVFYSDDETADLSDPALFSADFKDSRSQRIKDGNNVGYYGGDTVDIVSTSKVYLYPSLTVYNEEVLYAKISCYFKPSAADKSGEQTKIAGKIGYKITVSNVSDSTGKADESHSVTQLVPASALTEDASSNTYSYTLILDDLSSENTRFNKLYPTLIPGKDITITVSTYVEDADDIDVNIITGSASAQTNSLFADSSHYSEVFSKTAYALEYTDKFKDTAVIMYCRHLQNLDKSSGICDHTEDIKITKAIQIGDLDLGAEKDKTQNTGKDKVSDAEESLTTRYFRSCYSDKNHNDTDTFGNDGKVKIYDSTSTETTVTREIPYYNGTVTVSGNTESVPNFHPINNEYLTEYTGVVNEKGIGTSSDDVIKSYHSISNLVISDKSSDVSGLDYTDVGLFGSGCSALKKITGLDLVDTIVVSDNGSAGALIGKTWNSPNLAISYVRSYLSPAGRRELTGDGVDYKDIFISGKYAGGLIGYADGGTISITDSFAAGTVGNVMDDTANGIINDGRTSPVTSPAHSVSTESAGGLIGYVSSGTQTLTHSYADSYICGKITGGLVGKTGGQAVVDYCYASGFAYGFQKKGRADETRFMAGLVGGLATEQKNSYTVFTYLMDEENETETDTSKHIVYHIYSTSVSTWSSSGCYYLAGSDKNNQDLWGTTAIKEETRSELQAKLGSEFSADTGDTQAYDLSGQSLVTYAYPRLTDPKVMDRSGTEQSAVLEGYLAHQNDWTEDFKAGSLVYYEKYGATQAAYSEFISTKNENDEVYTDADLLKAAQGSDSPVYGFYGANANTLDEKNERMILGDGYAIVYMKTADYDKDIPDKIQVDVTVDDAVTGETHTLSQTMALKDRKDKAYVEPYTQTSTVVIGNKKQTATFLIYPISVKLCSTSHASAAYYQKVQVKTINSVGDGKRQDATTSSTDYYAYNPHFAKSVVPLTDENTELPTVSAGSAISIRTARHLYDLSQYYNVYADATKAAIFTQEEQIDYSAYEWVTDSAYRKFVLDANAKALTERIKVQMPIGDSTSASLKAFSAIYEGGYNEIRNISFAASVNSECAGLFGINAGTIRNVFLPADYKADSTDNHYSTLTKTIGQNVAAKIGVLAGLNGNTGVISNCAVAGFTLGNTSGIISAYESSNVFAGGLVGRNEGRITSSSADCPVMKLNSNFSYDYLGGFTGYNTGYINDCYALGAISTPSTRGGGAYIGGFAGYNSGSLINSYCATALVGSGERTTLYAFSSKDGSESSCEYLDQGTFSYLKKQYSFNADKDKTCGTSTLYSVLTEQAKQAQLTRETSFYHKNTKSVEKTYPFRGVVKNKNGQYIHYGEWLDDLVMGTLGVVYWEHETGGQNNGYHFTFLGTSEGENETVECTVGTSLCNAHDDGGVISEYGYGFYVQKGFGDKVKLVTENISISDNDSHEVVNKDAQTELAKQMTGYDVYPFTTKVTDDMSVEHVYLESDSCVAAGVFKLVYSGTEGNAPVTYKYTVSPFFANAMQFVSYQKEGAEEVTLADDKKISLTSADYTVSDLSKTPGSSDNSYEVRSAEQLQYINWNYKSKNCSQMVKNDRSADAYYKNFTYLFQASVTGKGIQTRDAAINNTERSWLQSHDINADSIENWTPIAAAGTTSSTTSYDAVLYAWFGGDYDGQSYKIKNININSKAYSVGLFGVTAGADISNVIMYSDKGSTIQRKTENADDYRGGYSLGGLVGIAYNYKSDTVSDHTISNCAIAGYSIQDNSRNRQTLGEVNVGGLIGASNVNLKQCSAVTDISLNALNAASGTYGGYVRCGGLSGANLGSVTDCYTGGSIKVGEDTLHELNGSVVSDLTKSVKAQKGACNHIFISGISGCAFTMTYINFENAGGSKNGTPVFNNCYTYIDLPDMEGCIRSVSIIGSVADRFGYGSEVPVFNNCYYLDSTADIKVNMPGYYFSRVLTTEEMLNKYLSQMLYGELDFGKTYYWNDGGNKDYSKTYNGFTALTYEQMSERINELTGDNAIIPVKNPLSGEKMSVSYTSFAKALNGTDESRDVWGFVTITEGDGISIDGKYSFPGVATALDGKNYPFATVIKQKNLAYSTADSTVYANVHYGQWPVNGLFWESAKASMDIFTDMNLTDDPSAENSLYGYAVKEFILKDRTGLIGEEQITPDRFTVNGQASGDGTYAQVISAVYDSEEKGYRVKVKALQSGSAKIAYGDTTFDLTITAAKLTMTVTPDTSTGNITFDEASNTVTYTPGNGKARLYLNAKCGETDISTLSQVTWNVSIPEQSTDVSIEITNPGVTETNPNGNGFVYLLPQKYGTSWTMQIKATLGYPLGVGTYTYTSDVKYINLASASALTLSYDTDAAGFKASVPDTLSLYSADNVKITKITVTDGENTYSLTQEENAIIKNNEYIITDGAETPTAVFKVTFTDPSSGESTVQSIIKITRPERDTGTVDESGNPIMETPELGNITFALEGTVTADGNTGSFAVSASNY